VRGWPRTRSTHAGDRDLSGFRSPAETGLQASTNSPHRPRKAARQLGRTLARPRGGQAAAIFAPKMTLTVCHVEFYIRPARSCATPVRSRLGLTNAAKIPHEFVVITRRLAPGRLGRSRAAGQAR
jgi:hypothetical protein